MMNIAPPDQIVNLDPKDIRTFIPWTTSLLKFWQEKIKDSKGGFFEAVDSKFDPVIEPSRNTFVAARLTFTYSNAFSVTKEPSFAKTAQHGFLYLINNCQSSEGGWYKQTVTDGSTTTRVQDSYTQAFMLLAMSEYFRVFLEGKAIEAAYKTWDFIEKFLQDKNHGGLLEIYDPDNQNILLPRTQNASMHMLEAVQSLYRATKDKKWLHCANSLVDFSQKHFVDKQTGGIIEFFDKDWNEWKKPFQSQAPDKSTAARQTGHTLENSRLLLEQYELTGDKIVLEYANRLFEFGMKGIETSGRMTGLVCDSLDEAGNKINETRSFWQCLELVALLSARERILGENHSEKKTTALTSIKEYFIHGNDVLWHNKITADGQPIDNEPSAARLIYHLYPAVINSSKLYF